ncbi:MAG: hypothetical protein KatS3mg076_2428 [Candidatus Binatia bacterium]|nr:MAG: hypothetical protein KatS3mg076_2428 [Candidatus Binatia bacterium]
MAETKIRVLKNGPYEVSGPVELLDHRGNAFRVDEETVYLCRCGQSSNKPFCDGTHSKVGFRSEETAG